MIIGKITGTVVCTQKDPSLIGKKMLIVQPLKLNDLSDSGAPVVALDVVGAGLGEIVLVVSGSSARMADNFGKVTVDQSIIGVIDTVEIQGRTVFDKSKF